MNEQSLREFGKIIGDLVQGKHLSRSLSRECYRQILLNLQPELQQGAFLAAHMAKGATVEEIAGAWEAVNLYDTQVIQPNIPEPACDIVGTGSDALKTVNVSSPVAPVVSACGIYVAKKGAQRVTGVSGASDIYQELGVDLGSPLELARSSLEKNRVCYLPGEAFLKSGWARLIQSMRFTSPFNVIGPLTMPCKATDTLLLGVYSKALASEMIAICKEIGMERALAYYGQSDEHPEELGIDEISVCGKTHCVELKGGTVNEYTLRPEDFGVKPSRYETIATRESARDNAVAALGVLSGKADTPLADFYAVNAAVALWLMDRSPDLKSATDRAREAMADGSALEALRGLVSTQNRFPEKGLERLEMMVREAN
ncbi:MAG: anthranilate phosphoribosyltransferase [Deltaproteobacteria bacterium]|nr:anthranilate phosphoribosyltransferase [Deltaproteobacteria bacterium]